MWCVYPKPLIWLQQYRRGKEFWILHQGPRCHKEHIIFHKFHFKQCNAYNLVPDLLSPSYKGKNTKNHHWSALVKVLQWIIIGLGDTTPQALHAVLSSTHARLAINNRPVSVLSSSKRNGWSYVKFHGPLWTCRSFNTKKVPDHCLCDLNNDITSPQNMFPGTKGSFSFGGSWLVFFEPSSWLNSPAWFRSAKWHISIMHKERELPFPTNADLAWHYVFPSLSSLPPVQEIHDFWFSFGFHPLKYMCSSHTDSPLLYEWWGRSHLLTWSHLSLLLLMPLRWEITK